MNNINKISTGVSFTYKTDSGYLTIYQGRLSNVVGFYTPAEYKRAMRLYGEIISNNISKYDELANA